MPTILDVSPPHHTVHALLRLVRAAQPISRAEIARTLGVHRSTITTLVKPFLASGAIREVAAETHTGRSGRPPVGLALHDGGELFVGVNVGVRQSQVGAATIAGAAVATETVDTPPDAETALAEIGDAIARVVRAAPGRSLAGIGVSVPGPVDAGRSSLLEAPHLGWRDVRVTERFRGIAAGLAGGDVPVTVENDATAAAIYERRRRWARASGEGALDDFVLVRAGTGIGVGLIINGEIYRGTGRGEGMGGEFGHTTVVAGGRPCVCGNRGCWEQYASARSAAALYFGDRVRTRGGPSLFAELVERAEAGEARAREVLERTGEYLGIGIANILNGVGISRVVVSGRIVLGYALLREPLFEAVRRTMAGHLTGWSIEAGGATGAGLGGAVEVAVDEHLVRAVDAGRRV
jgi:predicted NBD/HSP70 family sugar kinase